VVAGPASLMAALILAAALLLLFWASVIGAGPRTSAQLGPRERTLSNVRTNPATPRASLADLALPAFPATRRPMGATPVSLGRGNPFTR
jgi:hypothetical protein